MSVQLVEWFVLVVVVAVVVAAVVVLEMAWPVLVDSVVGLIVVAVVVCPCTTCCS